MADKGDRDIELLEQKLAESNNLTGHGKLLVAHEGKSGGFVFVFGALALAAFIATFVSDVPIFARIAAPFVSLIFVFLAVYSLPGDIQLYEHAVRINRILGGQVLPFDAIRGFGYDGYREVVPHGDGTETEHIGIAMTFQTIDRPKCTFKTYDEGRRNTHSKLYPICEAMVMLLADRAMAEVAESGFSRWTPSLKITTKGVAYLNPITQQWSELPLQSFKSQIDYEIDENNRFCLLDKSNGKRVHSEALSAMNFYPGFHQLLRQFGEPESHNLALTILLTLRQKRRVI